jgi:hypothetical protein
MEHGSAAIAAVATAAPSLLQGVFLLLSEQSLGSNV